MPGRRVWALVVLLGLGAGLRLYRLYDRDLWADEIFSILNARGRRSVEIDPGTPLGRACLLGQAEVVSGRELLAMGPGILHALENNNHPPFYYYALRGWPFQARTLSFILGLASIPLLFLVGKELFNERVAWAAATLFTVSPLEVFLSQEARMYSLVTFLALLSTFWLARGRYALYLLASSALVMTHYFAAFLLGAHLLWRRHRVMWGWLLLLALWAPVFFQQYRTKTSFELWLSRSEAEGYGWLWQALEIPGMLIKMAVGDWMLWQLVPSTWRTALPWILVLGILIVLGLRRDFTSLWLAIPLLAGFVVDLSFNLRSMHYAKYYAVAAPALFLVLARGAQRSKWLPLLAVAWFEVQSLQAYYGNQDRIPWTQVAEHLQAQSQPGDLVVAADPETLVCAVYHLSKPLEMTAIPRGLQPEHWPSLVKRWAEGRSRIWLLLPYPRIHTEKYQVLESLFPQPLQTQMDLGQVRIMLSEASAFVASTDHAP